MVRRTPSEHQSFMTRTFRGWPTAAVNLDCGSLFSASVLSGFHRYLLPERLHGRNL